MSSEADLLEFARRIALAKLATRAHSVAELRQALVKKNVPTEIIDELLMRFGEVGLVDDTSFAEQWVQSRHGYRHASKAALRRELRAKGVGDDEISAAVEMVDSDDELAAARAVARRRLRTLGGLDHDVVRRRLAGALTRRGFPPETVAEVVREYDSGSSGEFV